MRTCLCVLFALTALQSVAEAHFIFVVPSAEGSTARVVFSEDLEPDEGVSIDKIAGLQLFARSSGAQSERLRWTKGEHFLTAALRGSGDRLIHGSLDYGVLRKGGGAPFLLRYHPKAVIGPVVADGARVGDDVPVEVVAMGGPGKLRFQMLAAGKPVPHAEMRVIVPGEGEKQVKADGDGFSPEFGQSGRFGVWARHTERSAGEAGGERYEEVRHYATLVVDVRG